MSTITTIRAFIQARAENNDVPPSIEEVAKALGVTAATARKRLKECVDSGMMTWEPGKTRSYQLTDSGRRISGEGAAFR